MSESVLTTGKLEELVDVSKRFPLFGRLAIAYGVFESQISLLEHFYGAEVQEITQIRGRL